MTQSSDDKPSPSGDRAKADALGLNPKQRAFAERYAAGEDPEVAALAVGYAPKTAGKASYRLRRHPKVMAYLEHLGRMDDDVVPLPPSAIERVEDAISALMTKQGRMRYLAKIMVGESKDWVRHKGGIVRVEAKVRDKIRAARLLSQIAGDFVPEEGQAAPGTLVAVLGDVYSQTLTDPDANLPPLLAKPAPGPETIEVAPEAVAAAAQSPDEERPRPAKVNRPAKQGRPPRKGRKP